MLAILERSSTTVGTCTTQAPNQLYRLIVAMQICIRAKPKTRINLATVKYVKTVTTVVEGGDKYCIRCFGGLSLTSTAGGQILNSEI